MYIHIYIYIYIVYIYIHMIYIYTHIYIYIFMPRNRKFLERGAKHMVLKRVKGLFGLVFKLDAP